MEPSQRGAERQYDVMIVGGGPSGAALGTLLAAKGFSAVIIDKAKFPRRKPCGGALSAWAAQLVAEIFGPDALSRIAPVSTTACRIHFAGQFVAEVRDGPPVLLARRREMDAALLSIAARAGCAVKEGVRVAGVDRQRSAVRLATGDEVRGPIIVGADGANSVVARGAGGPRNTKRYSFCLAAEVPVERLRGWPVGDFEGGCLHIHFGVAARGYGWIFAGGDMASVGLHGALAKNPGLPQLFRNFIEAHCAAGTYGGLRVEGHLLPWGNFEHRPGRGNLLLLGDAAGLVDPVTGEGLGYALQSAVLAGRAIEQGLAHDRPDEAGPTYNRLLKQELLPRLSQAAHARWLLYPPPCLSLAMRSMKRHPELLCWFLEVVAGKMTYRRYAWRLLGTLLRG